MGQPQRKRKPSEIRKGHYADLINPEYKEARDETTERAIRVLKFIIQTNGISAAALANAMGLSESAFRDRLRGHVSIELGELAGIAKLLGFDVSVFFRNGIPFDDLTIPKGGKGDDLRRA